MKEIERILIDRDTIAEKVKKVGAKITADYKGEPILAVCVLRGASIFFADLVRELPSNTQIDFISVSSYGAGTSSSGEVRLVKDLSAPVLGRHVLIVEDIVDSGVTLNYLKKLLEARQPASVAVCTLLDKPERRKVELNPEYSCFTVPNEFVVGYGLDYDERFRTLKDVCVLSPKVYGE